MKTKASLTTNTSNGNSRRKLYKEIPFRSLKTFSYDISSVCPSSSKGFNIGVYYYA